MECMEDYVDSLAGGRVDYVGLDHTAFWVNRGETLLIAIETSNEIAARSDRFPTGWKEAEKNGWSYLLLCWELSGEHPLDPAVTFLNEQKGIGEFETHKTFVVYGSKQRALAALACGAVFDNCTIVLTQPDITDFFALNDLFDLKALDGSRLIVAYDPGSDEKLPRQQLKDIMKIYELRCWHLTTHIDDLLRSFEVLPKVLEMAASSQITLSWAYPVLRRRRELRYYWRSILKRLDPQTKPKTTIRLCQNVLPLTGGRVFKQKLQELNAE